MSFFLKRGSSFSGLSNVRKRLPSPEELFKEGYVYRRTMVLMVATWVRNFCILQHGELAFQGTWDAFRDDTSALVTYKISPDTKVSYVTKRANTLLIESPEWAQPLQFSCETEIEAKTWKAMISMEARKQGGAEVFPPPVRARFFEGLLFKTPPEADRWEERWFELSTNGELSYWQSQGNNKRGVIDLETCKVVPNKTDAPGICTPFYFQIHTFQKEPNSDNFRRRIFNLSAPTQVDYLNWLKALKLWIGVKRPLPFIDEDEDAPYKTGAEMVPAENNLPL